MFLEDWDRKMTSLNLSVAWRQRGRRVHLRQVRFVRKSSPAAVDHSGTSWWRHACSCRSCSRAHAERQTSDKDSPTLSSTCVSRSNRRRFWLRETSAENVVTLFLSSFSGVSNLWREQDKDLLQTGIYLCRSINIVVVWLRGRSFVIFLYSYCCYYFGADYKIRRC